MPESWSRPVVDSVMLPAHAQTSGLAYGSNNNALSRTGLGDWGSSGPSRDVWVCIVMNGDGTATVTTQGTNNIMRRSGTVPATLNTPGTTSVIATACPSYDQDPQTVRFTAISPTSVTMEVYNAGNYPTYGWAVVAPVVASCPADNFNNLDYEC